ncbi:TlpA family protein disulfide reductase [Virgibacillus necropolis]|uniref:Alkyl hydroperoxide reductase n=1 Tax=Virgibacillus necropolis TaxID=163877 RepID=A0A221M8F4_9BACI|nr:TlpA disulfide reductase family protein [Virgibacillus necropolis]ASN03911.1 alkyl hydroperoxide reductase [Virgibacillus necropolis]
MKKVIFIVIIIGMFGWAVYDFVYSSDETTNQKDGDNMSGNAITSPPMDKEDEKENVNSDEVGLDIGDYAPNFKLKTLDGETAQLSDYRGKQVVVNFWATWCPPCRAEIPDLQKFYDNKDVVILAINLTETEKSIDNVTKFVKEFEMTFPVLMDENSQVSNTYEVQAYPTSYMIDKNGRIQFKALGAMNYDMMLQEFKKMK